MTCNHCCGAEKLFDLKSARKEMKKYRKKGPGKATRALIAQTFKNVNSNATLLDIGGGIGSIQWAFFEKDGLSAIDVDASQGYLDVAQSYAKEMNYENKARFVHGDFVDQHDTITKADFVTLDKVICCYPDYKSLLKHATEKCDDTLGLVYPLGGSVSKMFALFSKVYFHLTKNPFRTYIHSPKEVEEFIYRQGFELVRKSKKFPWHVQSYRRVINI
jgi:magnesium-protoporphyrin O-methyltransferase